MESCFWPLANQVTYSMKSLLKKILPISVANALRRLRAEISYKKYSELSEEQIFTDIYAKGVWGHHSQPDERFYSGTGSHDALVVSPYIAAITTFLSSFPTKPDVVDLGCGDFAVGSQVRQMCAGYIACDIVAPLIERNRLKYAFLNVEFKHLDITLAPIPSGDVAFIRQVLQHLSNASIQRLIPNLQKQFKFIVLTEHVITTSEFEPNLDKPTGPDTRLALNSGIVLTEPPFNLRYASQNVICEAKEDGGIIRTIVYKL